MTDIMKKILFSLLLVSFLVLPISFTGCKRDGEVSGVSDPASSGIRNSSVSGEDNSDDLLTLLADLPVQYYPEGPSNVAETSIYESDEPLIISSFGPDGELPTEMEYPSIWVLFSQPVVPLSMPGKPSDTSPILNIDPPLKGVFRWYGTKLLSFDSSEKGLPQQIYNISISDKLMSLGGKHLSGRNGFSFHTEYLSLVSAVPGRSGVFPLDEVPVSEASRITLTFNYPVNLEIIDKYLRIISSGRNYEFDITRYIDTEGLMTKEELLKTAVLEVKGSFEEESIVHIRMLKGARSEAHFIGAPGDEEKSFITISPFIFVGVSSRSYSFPGSARGDSNPVFFEFSHSVEEKNINNYITSLPDLPVEASNITIWNNMVKISNLPVEYDKSYAFILSSAITDIYGRKLNKTQTVNVDIPEAVSYSWFPNLGSLMLESSFTPKIVYEFQNVFDGDWKVDSISDPYRSFNSDELVPYNFTGIEKNIRHFEVKDLSPWLSSAGTGWVGFSWNFEEPGEDGKRPEWGRRDLQLQVTDLALTTRYGYNRIVVLVSRLSSGEGVPGAEVSLMRDREIVKQITSDETGLALFYLEDGEYSRYFSDKDNRWKDHLRFKVDTDIDSIEFIPNNSHNIWHMGIYNVETPLAIQQPAMETFLFTDRGLYRPGETVTFRGIDRNLHLGEYSSFTGPYTIKLKEPSYRGKILDEEKGVTSDSGGFYGSFKLADDLPPGYYTLYYTRNGGSCQQSFQVANFERLSFSVNLHKPDMIQFSERDLNFTLFSSYLSGGVLEGAAYSYAWTKTPAFFKPDNFLWEDWNFGPGGWDQRYLLTIGDGTLGPDGKAIVKQKPTPEGIKGLPYIYSVEVRVQDESNQEVAARLSSLVHPSSFYIGMKLRTTGWSRFVEKGESAIIDFALVDPSGNPVQSTAIDRSSKINMELIHRTWKMVNQQGIGGRINTSYEEMEEIETSRSINSDSTGGSIEISPLKSGSYFIRLQTKDLKGRDVITNLPFYSTGGDWIRWGREDTQDINLEADKPVYKPGETAKLIIKSPLPEGEYLITIEREGIFDERIVHLEGGAQVIGIPIEEDYVPVVYVAVSSWSKRTRPPKHSYFEPDMDKPRGYFGITALNIDTASRTFDIAVETDKSSYNPGDEVEMTIRTSFNGDALPGAEITFMAVDRGVLDLINYHVPDPVRFFYSKDKFPLGTRGADSRSLLIDPVTYEVKDLQGGDSEGGKIERRDDFNPTAVFEPYLITNSRGEAFLHFTLPDSLTTYRFTAIGVKDNKFGIEEGELIAGNPINVLSLLPGKLRFRDTAISGVLLTNLSDNDEKITVSAASDLLNISGDKKVEIILGAGQTQVVNFTLSASSIGSGTVNFRIRSDILNEDLLSEVIVEKPYVAETFTTAGRIGNSVSDRGSVKESLVIPSVAEDGIGSLSLTLSPGFAGELKSAAEYLSEYPYNCFEQRSSRILSKLLLQGENSEEYVKSELAFISKYQNNDGGIPFWPEAGYRSSYYISLRVAHLLYLVKETGIKSDTQPDIDKLLKFINNPDEWVRQSDYLMAFRYYVSALNGQTISGAVDLLNRGVDRGDEPGLTAYAMLGLAFTEIKDDKRANLCLDRIRKFIRPGTRTIDITETDESTGFYASETETLSLLLILLQEIDPQGELVMRVANTLSLRKRNGYWGNTADTAWAMLALSTGADSDSVDFSVSVDIADTNLISASFQNKNQPGVEAIFNFTELPLKSLKRDTNLPLGIEKIGSGTLFYTASLKYALPSEILDPRDEGIGLYTTVTDIDGRTVNSEKLTAGKTYIQKIVVSSHREREYLSIRVPVPSGARILDASFVTTAIYGEKENTYDNYWYNPPRKEIRDNEVQYFFDSFESGKRDLEFYFRAIRPGVYPTPPIQAECMYEPEIFGRTAGRLVIIDEK